MKELSLLEISKILKNGGATLKGGKVLSLNRGFMVSVLGSEKQIKLNDKYSINWIKTIVNNYMNENKKAFVGVWVYNGIAYIDISVLIKNEKKALSFGKENKQLAIYDNKNKVCIEL